MTTLDMTRRQRIALLAGIVLLVSAAVCRAQTLSMSVRPPLPNQLLLGDPWSVDVVNASGASVRVALHAEITEVSTGLVFEAQSAAVDIAPGAHALSARQVEPITVIGTSGAIATQLGRLTSFPDGRYTICVEALPAAGGAPLGEGCIDHEVHAVLPPVLLGPYNGAAVSDPQVIWSWFMQPQVRGGAQVVCDLVVAEVLPHQTPEEALRRNPPVLVSPDLRAAVWQTNEAVRAFRSGATYAWHLIVRVGQDEVGQSEIWSFTYEAPIAHAAESTPPALVASPAPPAPAADRVAPISWRSTGQMLAESANQAGHLSSEPRSRALLEFDPTLLIYGSPLALNLLLTTEHDTGRSELRRGAFGFQGRGRRAGIEIRQQVTQEGESAPTPSYQARVDSLRDGAQIDQALDQNATLPALDESRTARELAAAADADSRDPMARVPDFSFGAVVPDYTQLTLSGTTLNGGSVEYQMGRAFAALAVGQVQREDAQGILAALPRDGGAPPQLFRDVYAARVGVGRRDGSHVIGTALFARDDGQSRAILSLADSSTGVAEEENIVLGLAARAASAKGLWVIDAEANASLFDRDREGARFTNRPDGGPGLFGSSDRQGAVSDWAGSLRGRLNASGGRMRLASGVRFVGPGYASVGIRGMRTDVLQADGSLDQTLAAGRVLIGTQIAWEKTGVVIPERGESEVRRLAARGEARPRRGWNVQLAYTRNDQTQRAAGGVSRITQSTDLVNVRLRNTARVGRLQSSAFLSYDWLRGDSGDEIGRNSSRVAQLAEMLSLPSGPRLFVRASRSVTSTDVADDADPRITAVEGSFIQDVGRWLQAEAGGSVTRGGETRGHGGFVGARIALGKDGSVDLRWEYDEITDPTDPTGRRTDHVVHAGVRFGG